MIAAHTPSKRFYADRDLSLPPKEYRPETRRELEELLMEAPSSLLLLGNGDHLQGHPAGKEVVRLHQLHRILEVDRQSQTIRFETGITWGGLREAAQREGLSLQRYGLYPSKATLGGLLGRPTLFTPRHRGGELKEGLLAMKGLSFEEARHGGEPYHYIPAPRKASGPDLRYRFLGAQGCMGPILEATLVVPAPQEEVLLLFSGVSLPDFSRILQGLYGQDIYPVTLAYDGLREHLQLFLSAPTVLLRARIEALKRLVVTSFPSINIEERDQDEAIRRRSWLEGRHPDRRSAYRQSFVGWYTFPHSSLLTLQGPLQSPGKGSPLFQNSPEIRAFHILLATPQYVEVFAEFEGLAPAPALEAFAFSAYQPRNKR